MFPEYGANIRSLVMELGKPGVDEEIMIRIRDAVKGSTPALKTVESIEDTSTGIRGAFMRISSGIKKILAPVGRVADVLTKTVAPLAKLPLISTVTNFFSAGGAKAGGFLKFLGLIGWVTFAFLKSKV